jgi:hypothetical protein
LVEIRSLLLLISYCCVPAPAFSAASSIILQSGATCVAPGVAFHLSRAIALNFSAPYSLLPPLQPLNLVFQANYSPCLCMLCQRLPDPLKRILRDLGQWVSLQMGLSRRAELYPWQG